MSAVLGIRVYLAGPFFNDAQRALVRELESVLESAGYEVWSPSRDGTHLPFDATYEEQRRVFFENAMNIDKCSVVVAIVEPNDDRPVVRAVQAFKAVTSSLIPQGLDMVAQGFRELLSSDTPSSLVMPAPRYPDTGTIWEMGYAYAKDRPVVMFTGLNLRKPNLMLARSCIAVARSSEDLIQVLSDYFNHGTKREYVGNIT